MDHAFVAELGLFEFVVESFVFGDLERRSQTLIIGPKAHQAADDCLVGAVSFAGARKRAVQLDAGALGRPADETPREQPQSARARRVRAGWADHDGPDDVEEADHGTGTRG